MRIIALKSAAQKAAAAQIAARKTTLRRLPIELEQVVDFCYNIEIEEVISRDN